MNVLTPTVALDFRDTERRSRLRSSHAIGHEFAARPRSSAAAARLLAALLFLGFCASRLTCAAESEPPALLDMSLKDLMQVEISSVAKKAQKRGEAAAAVYVIGNEELRRSGATGIPEALRLVPGLNVARIDSNKWAISARGFNGRFANKLLVLIDGRSVYTPTFSGVYWEAQDLPLEDVERIEVIRGPGASLWGSNAVNGVINIITKQARQTQGGSLTLGGGTYEKRFGSLRYGARLAEDTYARAYATGFARGEFETRNGDGARDAWEQYRGGFRLDRDPANGDSLTLQGDIYRGKLNQNLALPDLWPPRMITPGETSDMSGANLLGRWIRNLGADSELRVQAYYDHTYRNERILVEERDTLDLEAQHRFQPWLRHDIVWGLAYRWSKDDFSRRYPVIFDTRHSTRNLASIFLQDEISLIPQTLKFTLGARLEHNDYTGFEGQPNFRLLWKPDDRHSVWGAISRAVRIPSRAEDSARLAGFIAPPNAWASAIFLPTEFEGLGNGRFRAETVWTYELGYRFLPRADFSLDIALFYNHNANIRSQGGYYYALKNGPSGNYLQVVNVFGNELQGASYGAEIAADWHPLPRWRLQLNYSYLSMQLRARRGGLDRVTPEPINGAAPRQQVSLRSSFDIAADAQADLWLRYVDALPSSGFPEASSAVRIPAYVTLDARLAWRPARDIELSLVGQNLLDPRRLEYAQELYAPVLSQVPRGVYVRIDWKF